MTRASRIRTASDLRAAAERELDVDLPVVDFADLECGCSEHCRVCGCGDFHACQQGCSWVADPFDAGPLCSECLPGVAEYYKDLVLLEALGLIERYFADDDGAGDTPRVRTIGCGLPEPVGALPEPSGEADKQLDARWGDW